MIQDIGSWRRRSRGCSVVVESTRSCSSPRACVGAGMCCFCAVVEAECAPAGVAAEREKVELLAEGGLTVGADCFDVADGHFGVGCGGVLGVVRWV